MQDWDADKAIEEDVGGRSWLESDNPFAEWDRKSLTFEKVLDKLPMMDPNALWISSLNRRVEIFPL
jgi:hypothetical protein